MSGDKKNRNKSAYYHSTAIAVPEKALQWPGIQYGIKRQARLNLSVRILFEIQYWAKSKS
jgi:hypothetical protein